MRSRGKQIGGYDMLVCEARADIVREIGVEMARAL